MKKHFVALLGLGVLMIGLASSVVWAATSSFVKIPFSFFVNGKEMPAGRYEIRTEGEGADRLVLRDTAGGGASLLPVMTRLASTDAAKGQVVFDTADGKNYLSEVHFPGIDGFALTGAPGKHTHAKVSPTE